MEEYFEIDLRNLEIEIARDYAARSGSVIIAGNDDLNRIIRAMQKRLDECLGAIDKQTKEIICDRLDYCNRKDNEGAALARELLDAGIMIYFTIPVPPLKLAAYVVRRRYLDRVCACGA